MIMKSRAARQLVCAGLMIGGALAAAGAAQAATVTLAWVPLAGTTTSGSLTLSSASIVDPNNFSLTGTAAAINGDLSSFSYTFSGGTIDSTLAYGITAGTPLEIIFGNGSWSVSSGKLTSFFDISTVTNTVGTPGLYTLVGGIPGLPSPANALSGAGTYSALDGTYSATLTAGYWQVTAVPLPAALPLLLSGLLGMGTLLRRRPDRR